MPLGVHYNSRTMGSHPNPQDSIWRGVERRRSTRLNVSIPIVLRGKEATGREFRERTRAVALNNHGAKVVTAHQLLPGSELVIENPSAGLAAVGTVVWSGERRTPKDPFEIGVQLAKPGNVWGLEFPPENWQETVSATAAEASAPPEAEPVAAAAAAVASVPESEPELVASPPAPVNLPPGLEVQAVLAWLASRTEEIKEKQAQDFELRLSKIAGMVGTHTQTVIQESVTAATEKIQPELDRQLEPVNEKLRASRAEIEEVQRKLAEIQSKTISDAESAASRLQALEENARGEILVLESKLGEIRANFQAAVETGTQESTRLAVEKAVARVQEASREAAGYAREEFYAALRQNLAAESTAATEQFRARLQEETAAALEAGQKQAAEQFSALVGELQAKVQSQLQELLAQLLEQSRAQVNQTVDPLRTEIAAQLQKSALEAAGGLRADLENSLMKARSQLVENLANSVKEAQESSRQQLRQDAKEILAELRGELKAAVKSLADETRANLAALTRTTVAAMNREGQSGVEQYRTVLRKGLQEHVDKGARELAAQVEKSLEDRRAALEAQLQKAADEATAQAIINVRTSANGLLKGAAESLNQQKAAWEEAQKSAADAREQALARIRAAAEQSVADASEALKKETFATTAGLKDLNAQIDARLQTIPQQVEKHANAALDTVRQQSDATVASALARFIEHVQARLKDSERNFAQVLQGSEGRVWEMLQPRIQQFGDEMLAASAVQLRKQNEEIAALFAEQLKEKQQQAADVAVEAFRTKISEMLAIFQTGAKK